MHALWEALSRRINQMVLGKWLQVVVLVKVSCGRTEVVLARTHLLRGDVGGF